MQPIDHLPAIAVLSIDIVLLVVVLLVVNVDRCDDGKELEGHASAGIQPVAYGTLYCDKCSRRNLTVSLYIIAENSNNLDYIMYSTTDAD